VLDFGVAKLSGPDDLRPAWTTLEDEVLGTPAFMAPEQCRCAGLVDARSDIYALGAVLYFLLTGRPPFDHDEIEAVMGAHLTDPVPAPSSFAPEISPELETLVMRLLAKRPQDRPASMQMVHDELMALASQPSAMRFAVKPAVPYGPKPERASQAVLLQRQGVWLGVAGLTAFLLVAALGWQLDETSELSTLPPMPTAKAVARPITATPADAAVEPKQVVKTTVKAEVRPAGASKPPRIKESRPVATTPAHVVPPRESVKDGALDPFD
jgi:hypothetical protein